MKTEIFPGHKCMVYDIQQKAFRPAVVVKRYGYISEYMQREYGREAAKYPDCVDVKFDHDGRLSRGHFTESIK
jgi:hypothetical protein